MDLPRIAPMRVMPASVANWIARVVGTARETTTGIPGYQTFYTISEETRSVLSISMA